MSAILNTIKGQTVNLPVLGTVSGITLLALGVGAYLFFIRGRRRVSSVTTRYSRR